MDKTTNHPTHAVAYLRSATTTPGPNDVEHQQQAIQQQAQKDGLTIDKFYVDAGRSGIEIKSRQSLQDLLADAKEGNFEILYVTDGSRLSRNMQHSIELLKQLQENDVALRILSQRTEKGYPEIKFFLQTISPHEK
jgi:DNA invertase Pin-like site-specific DNA recombinase